MFDNPRALEMLALALADPRTFPDKVINEMTLDVRHVDQSINMHNLHRLRRVAQILLRLLVNSAKWSITTFDVRTLRAVLTAAQFNASNILHFRDKDSGIRAVSAGIAPVVTDPPYVGASLVHGRPDLITMTAINMMSDSEHSSARRPFKILAIDGGGSRGVISATLLCELEKDLGQPLTQMFDLIAGTSAGGLITLALTVGELGAAKMCDFAKTLPAQVWSQRQSLSATASALYGGFKYSPLPLENLLRQLADGNDPMLRDTTGHPAFFVVASSTERRGYSYLLRSFENPASKLEGTSDARVVEAGRATSAAPGYLPRQQILKKQYEDGGLASNNPAPLTFMEASTLWPDRELDLIVSIGSGGETLGQDKSGLINLIEGKLSGDVQNQDMQFFFEYTSQAHRLHRLQPPHLGGFATDETRPEFIQRMIEATHDYIRTDPAWAKVLGALRRPASRVNRANA